MTAHGVLPKEQKSSRVVVLRSLCQARDWSKVREAQTRGLRHNQKEELQNENSGDHRKHKLI